MDKLPVSSNLQGLENDESIPQGKPEDIINFNSDECQSTGEIVKEKADIYRLQDEDFRALVKKIESDPEYSSDDSKHIQQNPNPVSEWDPAVHPDVKPGRLHLSIKYDDQKNHLIVQIIEAQGMIRPNQIYASDMRLTFSLIINDRTEHALHKHERIFVNNVAIQWKEPMIFDGNYDQIIQQTLYILAKNDDDPTAPRSREVFIPLKDLKASGETINEWFDLQYVPSVP